ncbi:pyrroline-5-carboxylate reductase [Catenuloplanes atrovinosus]|uniref:Pyrroline-5-carboxylate reductase n=1 Tax=Catenuloplanes atrovinosus TaxID=137266 RepID=A0AAE3YRD8_9ACTN|nr:pyrroline-5-carboxylate reductase [Catenuloplanes atrovinosus]MDR7278225.1 pyrroline-5-carboxylate reductase [Catenuloplanes atrovinosus]
MSGRIVAVLGAGTMGELVLAGLLRGGHPADRALASARRPARAEELRAAHGVRVVDNATAAAEAEVLVIGVKPQDADALLREAAPHVRPGTLVVSLCAGLTTEFFARRLPEGTPVVRVMTNTPALAGAAISAISPGAHATDEHVTLAEELFRPLGAVLRVPENQQDAVTAVSGSGPAYVFLFVEAMIEAGVHLGLPRRTARELAVQTALGSATMLRDSGEHPVTLREAVTSPAGTTAAALAELERHGLRAAVLDALAAARDRAIALAAQNT